MNHKVTIGIDQHSDARMETGWEPGNPPLTLRLGRGGRARVTPKGADYKVAALMDPEGAPVSTWNDGSEVWSVGDTVYVGVEP